MAVNNRSQGRSPRERFVYVSIIPWQPVNKCYMSRHARAMRECVLLLELCNKVLIGPLNPRYRCNLLFLFRYQNFSFLVCTLKLAQFVVLIIDNVWACAS